MDFGAFPPEVNSARMYAGPGSAPMLAAASAWSQLAAELRAAAAGYSSVISGLAGQAWTGPAAASMAAAAAPYAAWMNTTAGQAEQTANQATAAAGAYENAFAATVPPPVIATNRAQLASLVATNVLGQNTPAIAANEAHYGEMWAQDAAAMYGYAGESAAASKVTPFAAPPQTTNQSGLAAQNAAAAQAGGTSAGSGVQSTLSQVVSTTPTALQGLSSPMSSGTGTPGVSGGSGLAPSDLLNGATNLGSGSFSPYSLAGITQVASDIALLRAFGAAGNSIGLSSGAGTGAVLIGATAPGLAGLGPAGLGGAGAVSAGIGRGTLIGALSAPQSWAAATPAPANPAAATSLVHSWAAAPDAGPGGMPGMPGMPMTGSGGRGFGFAAPRYGFKPTVMARPLVAG